MQGTQLINGPPKNQTGSKTEIFKNCGDFATRSMVQKFVAGVQIRESCDSHNCHKKITCHQ